MEAFYITVAIFVFVLWAKIRHAYKNNYEN